MVMCAGTYYIGDLCYVMHKEWSEFCTITNHNCNGEFALKDGRRFATYVTKYGDGCYPAIDGTMLSVDAGLIGCIRVEDISECDKHNIKCGTIVEFPLPFHTSVKDGTIVFGDFTVETDDCDDYDDDYDDEDEDEY